MHTLLVALTFAIGLSSMACAYGAARLVNGFDLSNLSVPRSQIQQGGPPRDGIPALDHPKFVDAQSAQWLAPNAQVLGFSIDGRSKAYPISILNWHELVNDAVGDVGVLISYCPLCGTGMAFASDVQSAEQDSTQRLSFGVSGLLYQSDVLFYDRATDSLWSQIDSQAISGPRRGTRLTQLPTTLTTWAKWRAQWPESQVLAQNQGFARNYDDDPYAGYDQSRRLFFKVAGKIPKAYHTKELVLGLRHGPQALALPFVELRKQGLPRFPIEFAGKRLTVEWDGDNNTATVVDGSGETQVHTVAYWFAWYAFHPHTKVFTHSAKP